MKRFLIALALLSLVIGGPSQAKELTIKEARHSITWARSPRANAKINLNTATSKELRKLPGVGELLAQRIIAARPFRKVEDLKQIKGITPKHYEKIKDLLKV
ncbi:MAG TPA: helix-hairpin-helix domain-containing protein [Chroococcales cyanobacterium]